MTLLEGLQRGIDRQLAVLDDAEMTGTRQSSADVLGVRGAVLAAKLTDHLLREIMFRGSGGGPLTPLANQLNHERTQRMLARLVGEGSDALGRAGRPMAGRPLSEMTDPFALEVHRPIRPKDPPVGLPVLPAYVPRGHDAELGLVVQAAVAGSSGIAVLVGGSSTGKTRACWEATPPRKPSGKKSMTYAAKGFSGNCSTALLPFVWLPKTTAPITAIALGAGVLFGVGVHSSVTLVRDWRKNGLKMVAIGLGAAAGFLIGRLFHAAGT